MLARCALRSEAGYTAGLRRKRWKFAAVNAVPLGSVHAERRLSWARSPHHLLRFCRSLFVLLGTCFARIVGALFATKVSF